MWTVARRIKIVAVNSGPGPGYTGPNQRKPPRMPPTDHVMSPDEFARTRLGQLQTDHRNLDAKIAALTAETVPCAFTLQRLKREKLALKDRIAQLSDRLIPDIIA